MADAVDNPAVLRVIGLSDYPQAYLGPAMRLARRAARTKFGLVYLVAGWLLLLVSPLLILERLEVL